MRGYGVKFIRCEQIKSHESHIFHKNKIKNLHRNIIANLARTNRRYRKDRKMSSNRL